MNRYRDIVYICVGIHGNHQTGTKISSTPDIRGSKIISFNFDCRQVERIQLNKAGSGAVSTPLLSVSRTPDLPAHPSMARLVLPVVMVITNWFVTDNALLE
ncbi:MAG: hypothetical protein ACLR17_08140 [Enterobacteriaceae bacterium]